MPSTFYASNEDELAQALDLEGVETIVLTSRTYNAPPSWHCDGVGSYCVRRSVVITFGGYQDTVVQYQTYPFSEPAVLQNNEPRFYVPNGVVFQVYYAGAGSVVNAEHVVATMRGLSLKSGQGGFDVRQGATLNLEGVTIEDLAGSRPVIKVSDDSAGDGAKAAFTARNLYVRNNRPATDGSVLWMDGGTATLTGAKIWENEAVGGRSGTLRVTGKGLLTLSSVLATQNTALKGSFLHVSGGDAYVNAQWIRAYENKVKSGWDGTDGDATILLEAGAHGRFQTKFEVFGGNEGGGMHNQGGVVWFVPAFFEGQDTNVQIEWNSCTYDNGWCNYRQTGSAKLYTSGRNHAIHDQLEQQEPWDLRQGSVYQHDPPTWRY